MRLPRFRVRTLMIAVSVVALVVWGAMMGTRPYDYYGRARRYVLEERGWRESAANGRFRVEFCSQCVDYFEELSRKYRRAMWRPWLPVAPDPHAPGFDQWLEQERRAKEGTPDPGVMKTWIGAAARSPQFCCARLRPLPPLRGVSPFGEGEGKKMTSALFENSGNLAMLFFLWSASRQLPKAWRPFGW